VEMQDCRSNCCGVDDQPNSGVHPDVCS
jgi:hypothetical protein